MGKYKKLKKQASKKEKQLKKHEELQRELIEAFSLENIRGFSYGANYGSDSLEDRLPL